MQMNIVLLRRPRTPLVLQIISIPDKVKLQVVSFCSSEPVEWAKEIQKLSGEAETAQGPHSQILMTGGVRHRFIFYTQKNHNFRICLPKNITTFLAYPKKSLRPDQFNFLFYKNFGQKIKIGGRKK